MAITDLITALLSFLFLVRGFSRGLMNSLINPFSIIVTSILSVIYYQHTQNMFISLAIGLIGPLLLSLLLKFLLNFWLKSTDAIVTPSFLSRVGGGILTLIWGWVFIVFGLILLAVFPSIGNTLTGLRNDVTKSMSYTLIALPLENIYFTVPNQNNIVTTQGPSKTNAQSLAQDPRIQKILQDPEIQQEIKAHDIAKLMSNPKMLALTQQIMNDPATLKKILSLYSPNK